MGSSGAYAVCAVQALRAPRARRSSTSALAEEACTIEIDVLGRTIGKQDQYAAAFGGVRAYTFRRDGSVEARELRLSDEMTRALEQDCLLFFTGIERSASDVLAGMATDGERGRAVLARIEELARATCTALEAGDLGRFAELTHSAWEASGPRARHGHAGDGLAPRPGTRGGAKSSRSAPAGVGSYRLRPDSERTRGPGGRGGASLGLDQRGAVALTAPFR